MEEIRRTQMLRFTTQCLFCDIQGSLFNTCIFLELADPGEVKCKTFRMRGKPAAAQGGEIS